MNVFRSRDSARRAGKNFHLMKTRHEGREGKLTKAAQQVREMVSELREGMDRLLERAHRDRSPGAEMGFGLQDEPNSLKGRAEAAEGEVAPMKQLLEQAKALGYQQLHESSCNYWSRIRARCRTRRRNIERYEKLDGKCGPAYTGGAGGHKYPRQTPAAPREWGRPRYPRCTTSPRRASACRPTGGHA